MAVQVVLCLTRRPDITHEQFRAHYENSHAPLAMSHMGHLVLDYQRYYPSCRLPTIDEAANGITEAERTYDAITVLTFANNEDREEFFRIAMAPGVGELFAEDEAKFMDRPKLVIHATDNEREVRAPDGTLIWPRG